MDLPEAPAPIEVELDRAHGLALRWADGVAGRFALVDLRRHCPCAECRGLRAKGLAVWPKPGDPEPLAAVDAELVGAWGITIRWNDGHATGIHSWGALRSWAAGEERAGDRD